MRIPLIAAFTFLAGCSMFTPVDEDNFADEYAKANCKVNKECFKAFYESEYDGEMEECLDVAEEAWEETEDLLDDCDFDDDKAADCLASIRAADCGDFYDADDYEDVYEDCAEVYDCD